ncbi:hypothetical protein [uncultured Duncaniella sp.]|uniref:hypothetical protein n=1 Tax=uncultured Duncaniella sp. TaxID=2768039 RepID=UPI002676AE3D|nr:hypothetical protein [uncultured Duncaniella sp.]MCI9173273.1 hypothetical protein [Muribaculaceae bacterium]
MPHPFDYLRHEEYPDAPPIEDYTSETISDSRDETITILTAEVEPGKWVAGYSVFWLNHRHSFLAPSLANGWFDSQRAAKLYYLGFMHGYLRFFTMDNQSAIINAINKYQQASLFE